MRLSATIILYPKQRTRYDGYPFIHLLNSGTNLLIIQISKPLAEGTCQNDLIFK